MKLRNIAVFASALTTLALATSGAVGSNYIQILKYRMKWYPEYGEHASSFNVNPVIYHKKVKNFLTEFNLLP